MRRSIVALLFVGCVITAVTPLLAHHSFAAEFDSTKVVTLRGAVTKIEWTNPHVWFYVNVKDADTGRMVNWGFEMGPPHGLQARGWTRETMQLGDEVIVNGFQARTGATRASVKTVTMAKTGKTLGGAPQNEGQAPEQP